MSTANERLSGLLDQHPDEPRIEIARMFLRDLKVPRSAAAILTPMVCGEIARIERRQVKVVERSSEAALIRVARRQSPRRPIDLPRGLTRARSRLLDKKFYPYGDGRAVTWGAATIEDHTLYMNIIDRQTEGLARTRRPHELAVQAIVQNEVSCLDEIEDFDESILEDGE